MRSDAIQILVVHPGQPGVLLWLYVTEKGRSVLSSKKVVIGILSLMMLVDLGGVGKRYLDKSNFISEATI